MFSYLYIYIFLFFRYVRLTNTENEPVEREAMTLNNMPSSIVGPQTVLPKQPMGGPPHINQMIHDPHRKNSPKFSHNTDRLPSSFCQPMMRNDIDLDSVGSSRSASSSVASTIKPPSLSLAGDSDKRTFSDSETASVASSSTSFKPQGILKDTGYNPAQYVHSQAVSELSQMKGFTWKSCFLLYI